MFRFGAFELDTDTCELRKSGRAVRVQPQPFQILGILVAHAGELVTREELIKAVWQGETFVEFDLGLNYCIRHLRSLLDDNPSSPRFIETVPRQGYRFIAPVTAVSPSTAPAVVVAEAGAYPSESVAFQEEVKAAEDRPTSLVESKAFRLAWIVAACALLALSAIAVLALRWRHLQSDARQSHRVKLVVLPFANETGDAGHEYLADGITDEIIARLGQMNGAQLAVIAHSSAMLYKNSNKRLAQIASELDVQYVLEGSIRRDSDKWRVTARLIRASNESQLWAETYDGQLGDEQILRSEDRVASRVAQSLAITLPPRGKRIGETENLDAHDAYLQGLFFLNKWTSDDVQRGVELFGRAVALDPKFAKAHAALASAYSVLADFNPSSKRENYSKKALESAELAVELAPDSSEAYTALAGAYSFLAYDFRRADPLFEKAIELDPSNTTARLWYGSLLAAAGQFERSFTHVDTAAQLSPLDLSIRANRGYIRHLAGDEHTALRYYREVFATDPNFQPCLEEAVLTYEQLGDMQNAAEMRRRRLEASGRADLAQAFLQKYRQNGYRSALTDILPAAKQGLEPGEIAMAYAYLGDKERALTELQMGVEQRLPYVMLIRSEPAFAQLRNDRRFQNFLAQLRY